MEWRVCRLGWPRLRKRLAVCQQWSEARLRPHLAEPLAAAAGSHRDLLRYCGRPMGFVGAGAAHTRRFAIGLPAPDNTIDVERRIGAENRDLLDQRLRHQ